MSFFENVLEHRSRLTSLHVHDHFLVHLVGVHVFNGLVELIGVQISSIWHGNEAWGTMVSKIPENLGVGVRLENLSSGGSISLHDLQESILVGLFALVVNFASSVDINSWSSFSSWLVEDLAWVWVLSVVSNVIFHNGDDLISWDSILNSNLISVASISLMSVVTVGF